MENSNADNKQGDTMKNLGNKLADEEEQNVKPGALGSELKDLINQSETK